jgi:manganese transport protein
MESLPTGPGLEENAPEPNQNNAQPPDSGAGEDHLPTLIGWQSAPPRASLSEVHRSIAVPDKAKFWRHFLAFFGPGYLIAVGYMDPGNWATDIGAGAMYNYGLLAVVLISNFIAVFLQALSAKLGLVTGRDLAQACRDAYSKPVSIGLWLSAEVGIVACDIAEVIGAAIALNLLFHIPMVWGVVLTGLDVLLVLALQHRGFRWIEALVIGLIGLMMVIFAIELVYAHPDWNLVWAGFVPHPDIVQNPDKLYLSLGILGATVMPHNLYLHSSIVQTRDHGAEKTDVRRAVRAAQIDSAVALTFALFVNAAILILAAAAFYKSGHHEVSKIETAYTLLTPLLGTALAAPLFAVALLASGQNSTLTGTLAGQVVLEGFTHFHLAPWARRLISRSLAIAPAVVAVGWFGQNGTDQLLIFSQVVLSIQLSFAVIPLIQFTSDKAKMGSFVNSPTIRVVGWMTAAVIAGLNAYLVWTTIFPAKK